MKKYNTTYKLLPVLALAAGLSACTFEQEDFFDETAALRIEHTNQDIQDKLVAGSADGRGWLIQYFVAGTDDATFEGFNLYGRFFESGKVTLSGNHRFLRNGNANKYTESTSVYEMLKEEGSVLSFSTWNDVLTVFVDPVSPSYAPNNLVGDGEGMNGDDRLVMVSYDADNMVFRGERHGAQVYFSRLDRTPEEYSADIDLLKSRVANAVVTEYALTNGDTTVYISGLNKGFFNIVDRLDDPLQTSVHACVFTPNGFRMEHSYGLKGDTVQTFVVDDAYTKLTSGNATLTPCWQRPFASRLAADGRLQFTDKEGGSAFASMYKTLSDAITASFSSQSLIGIGFGTSNESASNRRTGLVFTMKTSSKTYKVAFPGTAEMKGDQLILNFDVNDPSTNYTNYSKKDVDNEFTDIVTRMNGTYNLVPDNAFTMQSVKATKVDDPDWSFVMYP